jgi:hypothetical protein
MILPALHHTNCLSSSPHPAYPPGAAPRNKVQRWVFWVSTSMNPASI